MESSVVCCRRDEAISGVIAEVKPAVAVVDEAVVEAVVGEAVSGLADVVWSSWEGHWRRGRRK